MNRSVLITGAAGGLGRAVAARLVADGYHVTLCDLRAEAVERIAAELGERASAAAIDVTDEGSVRDAFSAASDIFGPLGGLVCCAGGTSMTRERQHGFSDISVDDWIWTEALNARGSFLCVREMLRHVRDFPVDNGRIVLTASLAAHRTARFGAGVAYSASKAAVIAIMRGAALEAAEHGMTVNAIAPGGFDTDAYHVTTRSEQMRNQIESIPLRRLGTPSEFAGLVAFLLSKEAGYITGATMDLNGGARMA